MKKKITSLAVASTMLLCVPMTSVFAAETTIHGSYETAVSEIKVPKFDEEGKRIDQGVSSYLKAHLDTANLSATKDDVAQTLTVDVDLVNARISNTYKNGADAPGRSYYDMMNYFTDVKQVDQMLDANTGYTVVDKDNINVDATYVDELLGLLQQINDFDVNTDLVYDANAAYDSNTFATNLDAGGTDVIATSAAKNAKVNFHIDSHGWWGYDLGAHDSITGLVMGLSDEDTDPSQVNNSPAYVQQHEQTTKYGNFFNIKMPTTNGSELHMLRNTDLENPMIYVSEDGREALMIDVDFYGENVLNEKIKAVIGDKCTSLKIFLTHNHGDHVNNLAKIYEDPDLRDIVQIIWPENEPHTMLNGVDLVTLFGAPKTVKDMEKFPAAGTNFQFVEIPNEHTPGGGQLADLDNKYMYNGDTLGAQVHLGGGSASYTTMDAWINGAKKSAKFMKDNNMKYYIGGHTGYLNTPEFSTWVATAVQSAKDQFAADPTYTGGLIIVENGKVVTGARMGEMFQKGLTDREELNIASMNVRDNRTDLNAVRDDKPVNTIVISDIEKQTYGGKAKEPQPTVTVNDKVLTLGADYALTYANNTEAGTATVTITGMNTYKGTLTKEFVIEKVTTNTDDKKPTDNKTPTVTPTGTTGTITSNKVKTGDTTNIMPYVVTLFTTMLAGVYVVIKKRLVK